MMTLLEKFTKSAYFEMLDISGLSSEAIIERIIQLVTANESLPLATPQIQQVQFLQSVEPLFNKAYIIGLSQTMLALAAVCIVGAVLVQFGLHNQNNAIVAEEN